MRSKDLAHSARTDSIKDFVRRDARRRRFERAPIVKSGDLEEAPRLLLCREQRLHALLQIGVAAARIGEKRGARLGRPAQCRVVDVFDLPPAYGVHGIPASALWTILRVKRNSQNTARANHFSLLRFQISK